MIHPDTDTYVLRPASQYRPDVRRATRYVDTLDAICEFVASHHPTTDELVGWHRGTFTSVSGRDSIMRRVRYLVQVGFLDQQADHWTLGEAGREYVQRPGREAFFRICVIRTPGCEASCTRFPQAR